jgi:hypothetical protein
VGTALHRMHGDGYIFARAFAHPTCGRFRVAE